MWKLNEIGCEVIDTESQTIAVGENAEASRKLYELVLEITSSMTKIYCTNQKCKDCGGWVERNKQDIANVMCLCDTCQTPMYPIPTHKYQYRLINHEDIDDLKKKLFEGRVWWISGYAYILIINYAGVEYNYYIKNKEWWCDLLDNHQDMVVKLYCRNDRCNSFGEYITRSSKVANSVVFVCDVCGKRMDIL